MLNKLKNIDIKRLKQDFFMQYSNWSKFRISIYVMLILGITGISIWQGIDIVGPTAIQNAFPLTNFDVIISWFGSVTICNYLFMVSQGKNIGYVYAIIGSIFWGINAIQANLWFQVILQFGIFLPLVSWGTYNWLTFDENNNESQAEKKLSSKNIFLIVIFLLLITTGLTFVVKYIPGNGQVADGMINGSLNIIKDPDWIYMSLDTIVAVFSIASVYLMIKGYSEAWYFWVIADILWFTLYIYGATANDNPALIGGAFSLFIYTANAIYSVFLNFKKN